MRSRATPVALPPDAVAAVQNALVAEHTLVWVYGLCTAFVSGAGAADLNSGLTQHMARRDATQRLLTDASVTPQPAEPAYQTPQPVTDANSAMAVLATAESEAEVAWRAVLENTDDTTLRGTGLAALTDSAVRQTRWRRLAGLSPASVALPGQPGSN